MQQPKILIVEDDAALRAIVSAYLQREGFEVDEVATGAAAARRFADSGIDLILLDVQLPDADGFDLLRSLREGSHRPPVIMLTGRCSPCDRVIGLELGADDYLCKPVELAELRARIRSVLRRAADPGTTTEAGVSEVLTFSTFTLDLTHSRLLAADGAEVPMTGGEFTLLRILAEHARRPLSRDQLLDLTRSRNWTPFDRSVDVLIGRIRRKLKASSNEAAPIKTVHNVGYMLAAEVKRRRIAATH